jgi:hypothetical protein
MFIEIFKKITFVYLVWVVTRKNGPRVLLRNRSGTPTHDTPDKTAFVCFWTFTSASAVTACPARPQLPIRPCESHLARQAVTASKATGYGLRSTPCRCLSGGILLKSCPEDLDCGAQGMNGKCNVNEDWNSGLD